MEGKIQETGSLELTKLMHKTIKGVTDDMEKMFYNTSIAKLMEFTNAVYKSTEPVSKADMEKFVLLLAPLAPHVAEELWEKLGHTKTLAYEAWPTFDEAMTKSETVDIVVQVMGKKRGIITVPVSITKEEVLKLAKETEGAKNFMEGKELLKEIYVPNRLVNFVVK